MLKLEETAIEEGLLYIWDVFFKPSMLLFVEKSKCEMSNGLPNLCQ